METKKVLKIRGNTIFHFHTWKLLTDCETIFWMGNNQGFYYGKAVNPVTKWKSYTLGIGKITLFWNSTRGFSYEIA